MPLFHSEDKDASNQLVLEWMRIDLKMKADPKCIEKNLNFEKNLNYAEKHNEVIQKFGRNPSRNAILSRKSTP